MASLRQVEANRRNALMSTGPQTEAGKKRSRGNAIRHGLTAETVIVGLEDAEDYKAFELSVTSDFDVQTAVERELVLRLASLLWRLRRAAAIETGLLQIQSEIQREARHAQAIQPRHHDRVLEAIRFGDGVRADGKWSGQGHAGRSRRIAQNNQCRGRAMFPATCQSRQWGIRATQPLRDSPLAPGRAGSHYARDVAAEAVIFTIQLEMEVLSFAKVRLVFFHALQHSLI